jgi:hypothetical protein
LQYNLTKRNNKKRCNFKSYTANQINNNQNNLNMTTLELIKTDLKKAIRTIITTNEVDMKFEDKVNEIMKTVPKPHTTVEIQSAQRDALKYIIFLKEEKDKDYQNIINQK